MSHNEKATVDMVEKQGGDHGVVVAAPQDAADISFFRSLRLHPKPMIMSVLMSLGPLAFGFDIIIVGVVTVFPAFL